MILAADVIFRVSDGAVSITGWGWFLVILAAALAGK